MTDPLIKTLGTLDADESTGWVRVPGNGKATMTLEGPFDGATVEIEAALSATPGASEVLDLGSDASFTEPSAKTLSLAPGMFIRATMTSFGASSEVEVKSFAFHQRQ